MNTTSVFKVFLPNRYSTWYIPKCSMSGLNSKPSFYDSRKFKCKLPEDNVSPKFEILPFIPSGIFRPTDGETLGKCASKEGLYKNPEYFSFHHMTFFDLMVYLAKYRKGVTPTGRKTNVRGN